MLLCVPKHNLTHDIKYVLHVNKTRYLCQSPPYHRINRDYVNYLFHSLQKKDGVQVLTTNNISKDPESKQKRLPDLCPRYQSPSYILRKLGLCSGQYISGQRIDLCSLRNLKEETNDLINEQAGNYRKKIE